MIIKIVIGWAATIPLAMAVSVAAFGALSSSYHDDPLCGVS